MKQKIAIGFLLLIPAAFQAAIIAEAFSLRAGIIALPIAWLVDVAVTYAMKEAIG